MTADLRVLVVDDDFRVAGVHADTVAHAPGFTVVRVEGTAAGAARAAEELPLDLALVDVHLPDGSGIDVVARLRCDALVLSAAADATTVRAAVAAGACGYLVKPFGTEDLHARLAAYRRYRGIVDGRPALAQDDVDRAFAALRADASPGRAAAKGRSAVTARLVVDATEAAGEPLTAAQLADRVGVSRATAQRYLADLVKSGEIDMRLRYGSTGRPEHEYWRRG